LLGLRRLVVVVVVVVVIVVVGFLYFDDGKSILESGSIRSRVIRVNGNCYHQRIRMRKMIVTTFMVRDVMLMIIMIIIIG